MKTFKWVLMVSFIFGSVTTYASKHMALGDSPLNCTGKLPTPRDKKDTNIMVASVLGYSNKAVQPVKKRKGKETQ